MKKLILILLFPGFWGCGNDSDSKLIEASGTIECLEVLISSQNIGEIKEIFVEQGSKVNVGDTLLTVDSDLLKINLIQAESVLKIAVANYTLLKKGARSEDLDIAKFNLDALETNYKNAQSDKIRFENLLKTNSVTEKQVQDILLKYQNSKSQLDAAKSNLKKVNTIILPEELEKAKAMVEQAVAGVDLLKKRIKDCFIVSPISGIIADKYFEKGELVSLNSSVVKIINLSTTELKVFVSEKELGRVKTGQKVEVSCDSFESETFTGEVIYISPEAEFTPKNIQTKDERTKLVFAVKIRIPNNEFKLKPGMPADAKIITEQK